MALQWQGQGQGVAIIGGKKARENNRAEEDRSGGETEGGAMSVDDDDGCTTATAALIQISSSSSSSSSSSGSVPTNTSDSAYCACTSLMNFWRSPISTGQPLYYYILVRIVMLMYFSNVAFVLCVCVF